MYMCAKVHPPCANAWKQEENIKFPFYHSAPHILRQNLTLKLKLCQLPGIPSNPQGSIYHNIGAKGLFTATQFTWVEGPNSVPDSYAAITHALRPKFVSKFIYLPVCVQY